MAGIVGKMSLLTSGTSRTFNYQTVDKMIQEGQRLVVIIAMPNTLLIDIAGPSDVFSTTNRVLQEGGGTSNSSYRIMLASPDDSLIIKTSSGISIACEKSIFDIEDKIDTLLIAGFSSSYKLEPKNKLVNWLKENSAKIRRIGSICRGAFLLAETGLLDSQRATTHWKLCEEFQRCFPKIKVDPDPIFVGNGKVYTSAGVSSGIDLSLALVEEDCGREVALSVARHLVLYLKRPGNQSQFSEVLAQYDSGSEPIKKLQKWLMEHLDEPLNVEHLAEFCSMSPRNFARVFQREMRMTPGKYLERLRVEAARRRLEETHLGLDQIADSCGLGSADTLRRLFLRHLKITPNQYRKSFRTALEQELPEMM